jgi:hypothetical protein
MRTSYRVIAWIIAALVAVQAAAIVFAISGLFAFIDGGGVVDGELDGEAIPEGVGIFVHATIGGYALPLLALVLLILSFFTRTRRAIWTAVALLVLMLLEVMLGYSGWSSPVAGALHGLNAMLVFTIALAAGLDLGARRAAAASHGRAEDADAPSADSSAVQG